MAQDINNPLSITVPLVFEITCIDPDFPTNLEFMWWLKNYVYTRSPDGMSPLYGRTTNPLAVKKEEAALLKSHVEMFIPPFIFISGDLSDDDRALVLIGLGVASSEYYGSFGYVTHVVPLVDPQYNLNLKLVLTNRVLAHSVYSSTSVFKKEDEARLAEYFVTFCYREPVLLHKLVLRYLHAEAELETWRVSVPYDE
ncbi:hypothetical protein COV24_02620 [candidate division WWE3 bacterium CG10_big_fil_rev_8_21_14_0_10_32_10]|uniref:Uncharacterized protein n=1 Tax=candidate division WWE3 bacterium CG10_big_fil_rev_8_21_14_0_10_32_10 TaxID=1975090 RepID=A0A2H0RAC8_UNCKA|nr:MAG: hypothetical protein COV24_02620 [candidate division WWE3 bacterium CG10_big_fil_rev_8_21_14_0_10_32_10]